MQALDGVARGGGVFLPRHMPATPTKAFTNRYNTHQTNANESVKFTTKTRTCIKKRTRVSGSVRVWGRVKRALELMVGCKRVWSLWLGGKGFRV